MSGRDKGVWVDIIKLKSGRSIVEVCPARGAAILAFAHDGQDIFKPVEAGWADDADPLKVSCFPLVPYSNRIRNGVFDFDGRTVDLRGGWSKHAHALHGVGWVRPWTVTRQAQDGVACTYRHTADQWPWDFTAEQDITLRGSGLSLRLSIRNDSDSPMPAGLGPHPYFPDKAAAQLQFAADGVWQSGDDDLPVRWTEYPPAWDFTRGRDLSDMRVDNCFTGFNGQARIAWSDKRYGVVIAAEGGLDFAVVYVPAQAPYFCFEPISHMNDAVNFAPTLAGTGLRVLAPGERLSLTTRFTVTDKARG